MPDDKADSAGPLTPRGGGQDHETRKAALRSELRQRRASLCASEQQSAADAAAAFVTRLPGWRDARNVALYFAANGELDPAPIATMARRDGKSLFLPVITTDNTLAFHHWPENAPLASNRFGIPEPAGNDAISAGDLDIVFLPLVGWDGRGGRLGMGGGFYDRSLDGVEGPAFVGLAHECQRVATIPMQDWDVRLHFVITERALHTCRAAV